jgi:GrpB-like predicted nucleotidyltransferase (UPF0157 family)
MSKKLQDMTLRELWELFPIILYPHNEVWKQWYREKAAEIRSYLHPEQIHRLSHIGSTAIPAIKAKGIVDILLEVPIEHFQEVLDLLRSRGWVLMHQDAWRVSLNQGYTPAGFAERVFHLHLHLPGDADEIYFRDYLLRHPEVANEYEKLKLGLEELYRNNRDDYTEAKTDFIRKYTAIAKAESGYEQAD